MTQPYFYRKWRFPIGNGLLGCEIVIKKLLSLALIFSKQLLFSLSEEIKQFSFMTMLTLATIGLEMCIIGIVSNVKTQRKLAFIPTFLQLKFHFLTLMLS